MIPLKEQPPLPTYRIGSVSDGGYVQGQLHLCDDFLKKGQTRPLFVYFDSFHMTNIAQIL